MIAVLTLLQRLLRVVDEGLSGSGDHDSTLFVKPREKQRGKDANFMRKRAFSIRKFHYKKEHKKMIEKSSLQT